AQSPSLLAKVHATEELLPLALTAAVGAPQRPGIRTVHRLLMHRQSVRKDHALHGELWRELLPLASGGITLDQGAGRPVAVIRLRQQRLVHVRLAFPGDDVTGALGGHGGGFEVFRLEQKSTAGIDAAPEVESSRTANVPNPWRQ